MNNSIDILPGNLSRKCGKLISFKSHMLAGKLADYIRLHVFDNSGLLQIATLSRHFGVCATSLAVLFKSRYEVSIHAFIMQLQHEMICELLADSSRSIKDIAYSAGYFELSNFSRDFTRMAGLSPTAYRESHRMKKQPASGI